MPSLGCHWWRGRAPCLRCSVSPPVAVRTTPSGLVEAGSVPRAGPGPRAAGEASIPGTPRPAGLDPTSDLSPLSDDNTIKLLNTKSNTLIMFVLHFVTIKLYDYR